MSKFKVGDEAIYVGSGMIVSGPRTGQKTPFGYGDKLSLLAGPIPHHGEIMWIVEFYDNGGFLYVPESSLRKIDDDGDEIPSSIRAIFSDKTDETLPVSVKAVKHEN